jgi:predicted ATPase/class 3 adenylate cyclase
VTIEFSVLGPLEAAGGDGSVRISGRKERVVLAVLVAWAGQVVSTDRMTDAVWGGRPPRSSLKLLQNMVLHLRKALGAGVIETAPLGYVLLTPPEAIDVQRFARMVSEGRASAANGEWSAAAAAWAGALDLWRGPPLVDLGEWPPAVAERARLEEMHSCVVEELAEAELACGRHRAWVADLETMAGNEPLRERRWALLALALYRCGRQAEALRAFQRARAALGELGLEPGPELQYLEQAVSVQDTSLELGDQGRGGGASFSGTVTFLFTDLEQSSRLWEADPEGMDRAVERHDWLVRSVLESGRGRVFSTAGDGFGAAFARPAEAVQAAIVAQRALRSEPWPNSIDLRARMGLHTGAASEREGGFFGPPVNRAARIMSTAHGGQVLVSQVTTQLVSEQRLGVRFVDLGRHRLRGLATPERLYQLVIDGDDGAYPPPAAEGLAGENLPVPRSSLHGREGDMAALAGLLATTRLVTLVGAGGVGKTRLALEVAHQIADRFDAVALVDLAPVSDPDVVTSAVAVALRVPIGERDSMTSGIIRALRARDVLVVLDNCEHVLDAIAELVDAITGAMSSTRVLTTSREPLGVEGEQRWPVQPLGEVDAAALFVARANAIRPGYMLGESDRQALAELCRRLDGLPLALELAAAQLGHLSMLELVGHLDDRFPLLAGGRARGHPRSRTLEATMEWSYHLLDTEEQRLLRASSIFAGGFTLESLAGVTATHPGAVEHAVGSLVAKSLVTVDDRSAPPTRYGMLETLREYLRQRVIDADEGSTLRNQHAVWFCERLDAVVASGAEVPQAGQTFCATELDNLLAALGRADEQGDLVRVGRMVSLLAIAISAYRWVDVAGRFLRRADIEQALGGDELALYLMAGAWNENALGHYREQLALAQLALEVASPDGPVPGYAGYLAVNALSVFDPDRGVNLAEELLMNACMWPPRVRRHVLAAKADCMIMSGDYVEGLAIYAEAYGPHRHDWPASLSLLLEVVGRHEDAKELVRTEVSTDEFYLFNLQLGRALVTASDGEHDQALTHLRAAAHLARVRPARLLDRDLLVTAAALALLRGDPRRASRLLAVQRNSLWTRSPCSWALYLHIREQVRKVLTRDEARHCQAQATSLTVDSALAAELGDAWPLEQ